MDFCSMMLAIDPAHRGCDLSRALLAEPRRDGCLRGVSTVFEYDPFDVDHELLEVAASLGLVQEPASNKDLIAWRLRLDADVGRWPAHPGMEVWDRSTARTTDLADLQASQRWWSDGTMAEADHAHWDETVGTVDGETIIVARDSAGRIVGCTFTHSMPGTRTGQSMWVMVRPDARGHGIGSELKRQQARHAAQSGQDLLVALTPASKAHAQGAWRRLGAESGRIRFFTRTSDPQRVRGGVRQR